MPYKKHTYPIDKMCSGCGRNKGIKCEVISEPGYIFESRGECWAKVDKDEASRIDGQLDKRSIR